MFGFSWSELMLVIVVAVIAVGPKQLPEVLYNLGKLFRRLQYMRYAMTKQFDDFMDQADLKDLRDQTRIVPQSLFDESAFDEEHVLMTGPPEEPKKEAASDDK